MKKSRMIDYSGRYATNEPRPALGKFGLPIILPSAPAIKAGRDKPNKAQFKREERSKR